MDVGFLFSDFFHLSRPFPSPFPFQQVIQTLQHLLKKLNQDNEQQQQQQHAKSMDSSNTRERVLTEILDTERRYVQDLDALEVSKINLMTLNGC